MRSRLREWFSSRSGPQGEAEPALTYQWLIADEDAAFREDLVKALGCFRQIAIAGQAATAYEAIRLAAELIPDMLLLDLDLPGGSLQVTQAVIAQCPRTKILLLARSPDRERLQAGIYAGAVAFILKGRTAQDVVDDLRQLRLPWRPPLQP